VDLDMDKKIKTKNLRTRIENIESYIGLARKLEEKTDEPQVLGFVSGTIDILEGLKEQYLQETNLQKFKISLEIEKEQFLAKRAYEDFNGDFEKAKKDRDKAKSPELEKVRQRLYHRGLEIAGQNEKVELDFFNELRKLGFNEENAVYIATEQPEIFYFVLLDRLESLYE
jgi:hypothetical protein